MATQAEILAKLELSVELLNSKLDLYFGMGQPIIATEPQPEEPQPSKKG